MGADLCISKVFEDNSKKYKPLFDSAVALRDSAKPELEAQAQEIVSYFYDRMYSAGYFRDSYNSSSLFAVIGLSWWRLADDYKLNAKGQWTIKQCTAIRQLIAEHIAACPSLQSFDGFISHSPKAFGGGEIFPDNTRQEVFEYFTSKAKDILEFFDTAISGKHKIRASV